MRDTLHIALAQINPTVGDLAGNAGLIANARLAAAADGADLLACPELALSGSPLDSLALHGGFLDAVEAAIAGLAAGTADGGPALLATAPWRVDGALHDAALLLDGGRVQAVRGRCAPAEPGALAPFAAAAPAGPMAIRGVPVGVMIGADLDLPDAAETLQESGAELLLVPGASPWLAEMPDLRLSLAVARVTETGLPLLWLNLLGGQDELVFDGGAFALNADRGLALQGPAFRAGLLSARWRRGPAGWACEPGILAPPPEGAAALWQALSLGLRDHVAKNGHARVRLAGGTGVGAALLAALCADALGADRLDADALDAEALGAAPEANGDALALSDLDRTRLALGQGAMTGDFAPLKDLHAGQLRALARWRNATLPPDARGPAGPVVEDRLLGEPAAADPAPLLDALLAGEDPVGEAAASLAAAFFAAERVRRRAPPGIRLTRSLLGRDRRYPITNAFRGGKEGR